MILTTFMWAGTTPYLSSCSAGESLAVPSLPSIDDMLPPDNNAHTSVIVPGVPPNARAGQTSSSSTTSSTSSTTKSAPSGAATVTRTESSTITRSSTTTSPTGTVTSSTSSSSTRETLSPEHSASAPPVPSLDSDLPEEANPPLVGQFYNVTRAYVRAGPGKSFESVTVMNEGDTLPVYALVGSDWVRVGIPESTYCYVLANQLQRPPVAEAALDDAALTDEIEMLAKNDNVPIYVWQSTRSTIIGRLKAAELVTMVDISTNKQWAKIRAPASTRAYVYKDLIRYDGAIPVIAYAAEYAKPGSAAEPAKASDPEIIQASKEELARREQEHQRLLDEMEERRQAADRRVDNVVKSVEERLKQIDANLVREHGDIIRRREEKRWINELDVRGVNQGGYEGILEKIAWNDTSTRPAYRLSRGGDTIYLLRSVKYNLEDFQNRRVYIDGQVEVMPGLEAPLMTVNTLTSYDAGPNLVQPPILSQSSYVSPTAPYTPIQPYPSSAAGSGANTGWTSSSSSWVGGGSAGSSSSQPYSSLYWPTAPTSGQGAPYSTTIAPVYGVGASGYTQPGMGAYASPPHQGDVFTGSAKPGPLVPVPMAPPAMPSPPRMRAFDESPVESHRPAGGTDVLRLDG